MSIINILYTQTINNIIFYHSIYVNFNLFCMMIRFPIYHLLISELIWCILTSFETFEYCLIIGSIHIVQFNWEHPLTLMTISRCSNQNHSSFFKKVNKDNIYMDKFCFGNLERNKFILLTY